jgi:3-oxoacyl-[acyl-carrier protein] reductase
MDLGLSGKVALVTASSKGLGRASAEALAGEGAAVAICARNPEALGEAEAAMRGRDAEVLAIPCDVTEEGVPAQLVEATVRRFGRLDIVVANAGGPPPMHALDVDDDSLRKAVGANLLTSVSLVRSALPHLRERGWGRICCIASYSVVQPIPQLALSNAARTGLWAWAKTAAYDLRGSGITLNLACPGRHATERQVALGGATGGGDPADFGRVVAFLCSAPASFVNGAALVVDGGDTLAL